MYQKALASVARLHPRAEAFIHLMRLDRPIGIYLLLWPTLWALWMAAEGVPSLGNLLIFTLGVILMRSAGCAINDFADRHFDGHVSRTQHRPLVSGRVSAREALVLFAVLVGLSFLLVPFTNAYTAWLPAAVREEALWARRSCFRREQLGLLVAEVFLPALWQRQAGLTL